MFFSRQQTAIDAKRAAMASAVRVLNEQAKVYQHLLLAIEEQLKQINLSLDRNQVARSQADAESNAEQQIQRQQELDQLVKQRSVLQAIIKLLVNEGRVLGEEKKTLCSSNNAIDILYWSLKASFGERDVFDTRLMDSITGSSPSRLDEFTLALEHFRLAQTEAEKITNQAMNLSFVLIMLRFLLMAALGIALPILIIEVLMMFHIILPLAVIALASVLTQLCLAGASMAVCTKQYNDEMNVLDQSINVEDLDFSELNTFLQRIEEHSEQPSPVF